MSFEFQEIKYFCPFFKDEEYFIKPKYYQNKSCTLLEVLCDMFPRKFLDQDGKNRTENYWRKIIEEEQRVGMILIFSDKVYRSYPTLQKPTKQDSTSFQTISHADKVVPSEVLEYFLPKNFDFSDHTQILLKGVRLKLRIFRQHIHPRSIAVPYLPRIVFEDEDIVAVNKPFGIPSMGETNELTTNEWNSILTWSRKGTTLRRDLMNRLDVDVSGLVLLGKSGSHRKKRGFAKIAKDNNKLVSSAKTVKIYLGIVPRQKEAKRILTPRLAFDKKQSKASIRDRKSQDNDFQTVCKTSLYPLLDFADGCHSLVAICLEESGQRHQIRFHLSLIGAAICNDSLYQSNNLRRTGVATSSYSRLANPKDISSNLDFSLVSVESIAQEEVALFCKQYIYVNGVTGFTERKPTNTLLDEKLIQRSLYPCNERDFESQMRSKFGEFCGYCGKCDALKGALALPLYEGEPNKSVNLEHGIFLHSWRYFHATPQHPILEADLPGTTNSNDLKVTEKRNYEWWPVKVVKSSTSTC